MKDIIQLGDPRLEKKSEKVKDISDPYIQSLIKEMFRVLESDIDRTAGLSAPQLGEMFRIVICRRLDKERTDAKKAIWEVMINPKIIEKSKKKSTYWEGCLSIKEGDLFGQVERPAEIRVNYFTEKGKQKSLKAKGYFAHVVQHEIDHLDGVLFLKYIKDPTKLYTGKELDEVLE